MRAAEAVARDEIDDATEWTRLGMEAVGETWGDPANDVLDDWVRDEGLDLPWRGERR